MPNGRIDTADDIAAGMAHLAAIDARFAEAARLTGPPPLRRRPEGFASLLQILISQQVSTASAAAIWARVEAAGLGDVAAAQQASDEAWRACGLSRPKIRYAKAIAEADLDYAALAGLDQPEAMARLTAITGIGRWTAEVYLMFCCGGRDVFAPGDLALQEAARLLFDLPERPKPDAFDQMAAAWSPWRAVAARLLWAYYRHAKGREGVTGDGA
jgi:DNA-3-methyladenine glycosylase II